MNRNNVFGLSQTSDLVPLAAVSQNVLAVSAQLAFDRAYGETPVGLADANIMPAFLFTGTDDRGAKIEGIEQDGNLERSRQVCPSNGLSRQVGKFMKRELKRLDMLFLDVEPGTPRYGYAAVVEADLNYGMSETILAGGVMAQLSDGLHFLASLKRLRVINNQEDVSVVFAKQAPQHIHCNSLHNLRFTPAASPQKLPMIRPVSRAPQGLSEAFYSAAMIYGDSQNQWPKVSPSSLRERASKWPEKTLQFSRYFADSNHTASPTITCCSQKCYRLSRPFLFDNYYHRNPKDRSV